MTGGLVTGGAGFLVSPLSKRLPGDGNGVLCIDNYYPGRESNFTHLINDRCFQLIRHDIIFPLYVETDEIYNLACSTKCFAHHADTGSETGT